MSKPWVVQPIWAGETVAILASGQSMNQEVADQVRGLRTIAINTTFQVAPWADMLFAGDERWWNSYRNEVAGFKGLKVTTEPTAVPDVLQLKTSGPLGFDDDPGTIRTGGNSGYGAIHIAAHAGCKRILLCGFDMHGGRWHGRHPEPLRNGGDGIYQGWIERFDTLAPELIKRGISVINCTPGSALKCFPMADLKETLEACTLSPA